MLLEISGCSRRNKGAELMLIAIRKHFKLLDPANQFAVDNWFGDYEDRATYGLWVRPDLKRKGRGSLSLKMMPHSLKHSLGIVDLVQIDATLNAAGFAYGDIHGPKPTEALARTIERFKQDRPRPFILLPQAFGPFTTPRIRRAMLRVAETADLIFARDHQSFDLLREVCGERKTIRIAPDWTAAVSTERGEAVSGGNVLVIPNARMLDKTAPKIAQGYVPMLVNLIESIQTKGLKAEILLHDRDEDAAVAWQINVQLSKPLPVISADDPLQLKYLIGNAALVIGSRFHALIGALSQAVPAIGIGWSHKYEALFADYKCPDCLLPVGAEQNKIEFAFDRTLEGSGTLQTQLKDVAAEQIALISNMWTDIDRCIGVSMPKSRAKASEAS